MANSYISFRNTHKKVADFDIIFLVFFMWQISSKEGGGLDAIFASWFDSIDSGGAGNIDLNLDEILGSDDKKSALIDLVSRTRNCISSLPEVIPPEKIVEIVPIDGIRFGYYNRDFLENAANSLLAVILEKE
jgi:hypothetical protein